MKLSQTTCASCNCGGGAINPALHQTLRGSRPCGINSSWGRSLFIGAPFYIVLKVPYVPEHLPAPCNGSVQLGWGQEASPYEATWPSPVGKCCLWWHAAALCCVHVHDFLVSLGFVAAPSVLPLDLTRCFSPAGSDSHTEIIRSATRQSSALKTNSWSFH